MQRKYCINPGCTGPTRHNAALSILCVSAKRPLSPTCSSDGKKSTPSSHPAPVDGNYGSSEAERSPSQIHCHGPFCSCSNSLFSANDSDLVLVSVFLQSSQTICVSIVAGSSGCPNICCRRTTSRQNAPLSPREDSKSLPVKLLDRKLTNCRQAQLSSQNTKTGRKKKPTQNKTSSICGENSEEEIKLQTQVPDKTNC